MQERCYKKCHCKVSVDGNGNIGYEISEDIKTYTSQITSVTPANHENVLCLSCEDRRCTFVQFSNR